MTDNTRKKSPTLNRELRMAIVGSMVVIVILYSLGMILFFLSGIDLASSVEMKGLAASYKEELRDNPNPQKPILRNVYHAFAYTDLPTRFQKVFADEKIVPGRPAITPNNINENDDRPDTIFMLLMEPLPDGRTLYLGRELIVHPSIEDSDIIQPDDLEFMLYSAAILAICLVLALAFWLNRRIQAPITALRAWAGDLTGANAEQDRPDFRYQELNQIADHLAGSITRIDQFVRREQEFLRQASHELRTPIAVISGNVSVLDAMELSAMQRKASTRIGRASRSMQHIVTTLLWLSRENEPVPDNATIDLADLIRNTITNHDYLLTSKDIAVATKLPPTTIQAPLVPLEIAAANMIRNGFQHTEDGQVIIIIDAAGITVENTITDTSQDPGAGLLAGGGVGLNLIRRIADRLGWRFTLSVAGRTVTARLDVADPHADARAEPQAIA